MNKIYMRKPPLKLQVLSAKLPKHAFVVILDGDVQNPEFATDYVTGEKGWEGMMEKWKRTVYPQLARSNVEYWEWHRGEGWSISTKVRAYGR